MKTMKKIKENRRWTSAECLDATYPKSDRARMLRLAVLSGLVRRMEMADEQDLLTLFECHDPRGYGLNLYLA